MKILSELYVPLVVSVGQVVIFPYYILWLKEASLTFTLFTWLFAAFSFSAALGYRMHQAGKKPANSYIPFLYMGMGGVYLFVGNISTSFEVLPFLALLFQVILGFLQGYHHAWHIEQNTFRLHAINHYLLVGIIMVALSFVKIISPTIFITIFGATLFICGLVFIFMKNNMDSAVSN
ncbi:hypothetical protein [Neobacillus niacini]|uniref:hypothetical protein n=1 Tax=Neobacillus niacini TaxID=86668 RepID=UPI00203C7471|nr:hypothetical protein [Neobacillus niacini]MCM3690832.1 hypothetical protein [Neobacillus niacini]